MDAFGDLAPQSLPSLHETKTAQVNMDHSQFVAGKLVEACSRLASLKAQRAQLDEQIQIQTISQAAYARELRKLWPSGQKGIAVGDVFITQSLVGLQIDHLTLLEVS